MIYFNMMYFNMMYFNMIYFNMIYFNMMYDDNDVAVKDGLFYHNKMNGRKISRGFEELS